MLFTIYLSDKVHQAIDADLRSKIKKRSKSAGGRPPSRSQVINEILERHYKIKRG